MDSEQQSRRSAFVFPVRAQPQAGGLPVVLSKVASLAILAAIVTAAWVAFSFVRTGLAGSREDTPPPAGAHIPQSAAKSQPAKREPLVYLAESDSTYYHQCGHTPDDSPREAVPVSLAKTRGFAPCPECTLR
jgi:hypothetical protein